MLFSLRRPLLRGSLSLNRRTLVDGSSRIDRARARYNATSRQSSQCATGERSTLERRDSPTESLCDGIMSPQGSCPSDVIWSGAKELKSPITTVAANAEIL